MTKNQPKLAIITLVVATLVLSTQWGHSQGITYLQSMFNRKSTSDKTDSPKKAAAKDNLGPSVQEIHRLATQMTGQIGWEISRNKDASKELSAIHTEMRKHSTLTANLVKAYKGDSVKTFDSAAVEVRKSVIKIEELCEKSEVSSSVTQIVKRSVPISTFIGEHRSSFKPK